MYCTRRTGGDGLHRGGDLARHVRAEHRELRRRHACTHEGRWGRRLRAGIQRAMRPLLRTPSSEGAPPPGPVHRRWCIGWQRAALRKRSGLWSGGRVGGRARGQDFWPRRRAARRVLQATLDLDADAAMLAGPVAGREAVALRAGVGRLGGAHSERDEQWRLAYRLQLHVPRVHEHRHEVRVVGVHVGACGGGGR